MAFEKVVGKGENGNNCILFFRQCFLLLHIFHNLGHLFLKPACSEQGKVVVNVCACVCPDLCIPQISTFMDRFQNNLAQLFAMTLFQTSLSFYYVCSTSLLKTLLEQEKLLVRSNFSFSHSVFYLSGKRSAT